MVPGPGRTKKNHPSLDGFYSVLVPHSCSLCFQGGDTLLLPSDAKSCKQFYWSCNHPTNWFFSLLLFCHELWQDGLPLRFFQLEKQEGGNRWYLDLNNPRRLILRKYMVQFSSRQQSFMVQGSLFYHPSSPFVFSALHWGNT